jgi:hypothetical protein
MRAALLVPGIGGMTGYYLQSASAPVIIAPPKICFQGRQCDFYDTNTMGWFILALSKATA